MVPAGKVNKGGTSGSSTSTPAPVYQKPIRLIPGSFNAIILCLRASIKSFCITAGMSAEMAAAQAAKLSKAAEKKKREDAKKEEANKSAAPVSSVFHGIQESKSSNGSEQLSAVDVDKKLKALRKKLKLIEELKEKKAQGVEMNSDQDAKIISESEVMQQIADLSILQKTFTGAV